MQDDVPKIERKYPIFKTNVASIKTRVSIDNNSEAKLIDKFFVRLHRISMFKLTEDKI